MKKKIGIIGCGNMGGAILERGLKHKRQKFIIIEKDKLKQAFICREFRVKAARDIIDLVKKTNILIIAVKPQDIDAVLDNIHQAIKSIRKRNILIISIAAGIQIGYIENKISGRVRVVRAMPNMPALIGEGITALCKGHFATRSDLNFARSIFGCLGKTLVIKKESLIDVVTAVSGSGPAYMFFIFAAMLGVAEGLGLSKKDSNTLLYHTIIGSMDLLNKNKFNASSLISKVASKGGTTEAAFKIFKDRKLNKIIIDALIAAHKRARELSRS